jgi:hypothetical protein
LLLFQRGQWLWKDILPGENNHPGAKDGQNPIYIYSGSIYANIGLQGAVSEIIPNLIQAGSGIAGGLLAFAAYKKIVKD